MLCQRSAHLAEDTCRVFVWWFIQTIVHPFALASRHDDPGPAQISKMTRDFRLTDFQNLNQSCLGLGVIHWLAYNIPADVTSFVEGETSQPSPKYTGGKGTAGQGIYMGPCTPVGAPHHYTFTMIATDLDPGALPAGLTYPELMSKLDGHAKGGTGLIGVWQNPNTNK